jgi:pimeloyl-ACP methyl ester carboxylesterase
METETFGDPDDPDLAFVLGWGNRPGHETVRWLIDRLAERYRVHAFEVPVNGTDFEGEYLDPVVEYVADLGAYRLLGHSTGGLVAAHVRDPAPETRTHLSPWWGFADDQRGPLLSLVTRVPSARQVIPSGASTREALGALASDEQLADSPDRVSPAFLRTIRGAQRSLPPVEDDVVFYTPEDTVVSPQAIERRVPPRNRVAYEGGHELFSSPAREDHLGTLLAAVEEGPAALE